MGKEVSRNNILKRLLKFFFAVVSVSLIISFSLYFWFPEYINFIIEEDHLVENISAFSYLLAFFLGLWVLKNYSSWRKLTWLVAIIGLIGFLDELSFGSRIIAFAEPELLGKNINALHDFFFIGYIFFTNLVGLYGVLFLVLGFSAGIIFLYFRQYRFRIKDFIGDPTTPPGLFLVLFAFFVIAAQIADLKGFIAPLVIIEELFEMYGGIALCLYSISLAEMLQIAESTETAVDSSVVEPNE